MTHQQMVLVPKSFLDGIIETQNKILGMLQQDVTVSKPAIESDYISEADAAKHFGRKKTWFWNLRNTGALPFSKVGGKVFYSKKDIEDMIAKNKIIKDY